MFDLTFLGAAGTVTGSKTLLEVGDTRLLLMAALVIADQLAASLIRIEDLEDEVTAMKSARKLGLNIPEDLGLALAMSPDQTSPSMTKISSGQKCPEGCSFDSQSCLPSLADRVTKERFCPEKKITS